MDWQPIETAPKDGKEFLAYDAKDGDYEIVYWDGAHFREDVFAVTWATHWMLLPAPPATSAE